MASPTAGRSFLERKPSGPCLWAVFLLLWPWSLLYRLAVAVRAALYSRGLKASYRAGVPVIAIGNLTVGGTGKTPVTDAVVRRLISLGHKVAVVSRGYGGSFRGEVGRVAAGDGRLLMSAAAAGDEPCLLARRNPELTVFVARKRALGVRAAEAAGAQVIVLDDGFQHLAVQRDLDIVLLDSRAPFGNGHLLPAGALREAPAALSRADLVVLTHTAAQGTPGLPFAGPVLRCRHRLADSLVSLAGEVTPWSAVVGRRVAAFAGIARPEDFFSALAARGVTLAAQLPLKDHQDFSAQLLKELQGLCDNAELLITTEKDAVKLRAADFPCPCLAVPLEVEFDGGGELDRILEQVVGRVLS